MAATRQNEIKLSITVVAMKTGTAGRFIVCETDIRAGHSKRPNYVSEFTILYERWAASSEQPAMNNFDDFYNQELRRQVERESGTLILSAGRVSSRDAIVPA